MFVATKNYHTLFTPFLSLNNNKGIPSNEEFDFESNLATFDKVQSSPSNEKEETTSDTVYSKDDFFDSISCDALDKASGVDNRLRGAKERSLNLDTFGAVSLGHRRGRGRGRGGRGGRGRGRGGGGGSGRGRYERRGEREQGSGPVPRQNNRWKEST